MEKIGQLTDMIENGFIVNPKLFYGIPQGEILSMPYETLKDACLKASGLSEKDLVVEIHKRREDPDSSIGERAACSRILAVLFNAPDSNIM